MEFIKMSFFGAVWKAQIIGYSVFCVLHAPNPIKQDVCGPFHLTSKKIDSNVHILMQNDHFESTIQVEWTRTRKHRVFVVQSNVSKTVWGVVKIACILVFLVSKCVCKPFYFHLFYANGIFGANVCIVTFACMVFWTFKFRCKTMFFCRITTKCDHFVSVFVVFGVRRLPTWLYKCLRGVTKSSAGVVVFDRSEFVW